MPSGAGGQSFSAGTRYYAPEHPNAVGAADFNGDGRIDLAVPSYSPNSLAIYLGMAEGGFADPVTYTSGAGPRSVAVADFNQDGRPDVAVANQDSHDVSIFQTAASGAMVRVQRVPVGLKPYNLTQADFNGDGRPDLLVANSGSNTASVLLSDAAGTFTAGVAVNVGGDPRGTAAADFNADGHTDFAVSGLASGEVVVFLGSGDGAFGPGYVLPTAFAGPYGLVASDLDGDGKPDLAVANFNAQSVMILPGDGAGGFAAPVTIPVGRSPRGFLNTDLNSDGRPDLVVLNRDENTISVLLGDSAGAFTAPATFGVGSGPFAVAAVPARAGGIVDLVVADRDGHTLTVLAGDGLGGFAAPLPVRTGISPRGIAAGDLDGDGYADMVTANNGSNSVSAFFGQGNGRMSFPATLAVGRSPYGGAIADFDGNGVADIAVLNGSANSISVLRGQGGRTFLPAVASSAGSGPRAMAVGDFNNDGRLDVATANFNGNSASVLLGNGAGGFAAPVSLPAGITPTGMAAGDFNRDGHLDFATSNSGSHNVTVFVGSAAGTFTKLPPIAAGDAPSGIAAADLDGDAILDLVVSNEKSNDVSVLTGDGAGGFVVGPRLAVGARPLGVIAAELTGDSRPDVAVASATSNTVTVLAGREDGSFDAGVTLGAGVFARALAAADFDGDSQLDLAVANGNGNDAWVVLNRTGRVADLAVAVTADSSVVRGQPATFQGTVTNNGPASATGLVLPLAVPAGLTGVVFTASSGAYDSSTGSWTGVTLAPGESATVVLTGTVDDTAVGRMELTAGVSGVGSIDPNAANNTHVGGSNVIRGLSDLRVTINNGRSSVAAGDHVTYMVIVTNDGPTDASGVRAALTTGASVTGISWTCTPGNGAACAAAGSGPVDELVTIASGATMTLVVNGTIDAAAAAGVLVATAQVTVPADLVDGNPGNDRASDSDPLAGNRAPVAGSQALTVAEDGAVGLTLTGSDPDGTPLTFTIAAAPAHGTLSGAAPNLTYTPHANYSGADTFAYSVSDGSLSTSGSVSIAVAAVNDPPVSASQALLTDEDVTVTIPLNAADVDGDPLTYTVVNTPSLGALTWAGGSVTYTPAANVSGADSFSFVVSDGVAQAGPYTITITVAARNDAPTVVSPIPAVNASGDATSAQADLAGRFTDVETPAALTFAARSSDPSLVTPGISGTAVTLTLAEGRGGTATVTVRATDPDGAWTEQSFSVTVVRPGVRLSVANTSRGEGASGGLQFTVTLSSASTETVTVQYGTADGTAVASDYVAASGTLTFSPGVVSRTVAVATVSDVLDEDDETVRLLLLNSVGGVVDGGPGVGTIVDNDTSALSVLDISVPEGDGAPTAATFTVSLSTPSVREISVAFATVAVSGSAAAGTDYAVRSGTLVFPAGSVAPQTASIDVLGDVADEANEAFSFILSGAVNAAITRSTARATIVDDDNPPVVGVSDVTVTEGQSGTKAMVFTFTLSSASGLTTRVKYQTEDGSAAAGSDFTSRAGEVVFAAGTTVMTVSIAITGDLVAEPNETFFLNLHTPVNVTIGDAQGVGTILNDHSGG